MDDDRRRSTWVDQVVTVAAGPVHVRLVPDVGVTFPVEVVEDDAPGYVAPGMLGLSPQLEDDLVAWQRWWDRHVDPDGDEAVAGDDSAWQRWYDAGQRLRARLQHEIGVGFSVEVPSSAAEE